MERMVKSTAKRFPREVNEELKKYWASADTGIILLDKNLKIRKYNPAAETLAKMSRSDIGCPAVTLAKRLRYDNLEADIRGVVSHYSGIEKEVTLFGDLLFSVRTFPWWCGNNEICGVAVALRQLHAENNPGQLLHHLFNSSLQALIVLEPVHNARPADFRIVAINPCMAQHFDISDREAHHQSFRKYLPAFATDEVIHKLVSLLNETGSVEFEHHYKLRDAHRWLEVNAVKLGNGVAASCKDITARKQNEANSEHPSPEWIPPDVTRLLEERVQERTQELERANQQLTTSNDELQQFASVASHDLKEPLRKINMFSTLLKENHIRSNDTARLYIDRIIHSSERMMRLVNDLLSFSRLSAEGAYETIDLNWILNEVLADLELNIQEKKATVEMDELPKAEVMPGQIRQVFQNILSNALKFSRKDVPVYISISSEIIKEKNIDSAADENGSYCRISIADNGIGFSEEHLSKIFTIFQRLHSRAEYDGTGIGLAICKRIVEKHGGLITARSQENAGSTFIIVLPLKQCQPNTAGKDNVVQMSQSVKTGTGR